MGTIIETAAHAEAEPDVRGRMQADQQTRLKRGNTVAVEVGGFRTDVDLPDVTKARHPTSHATTSPYVLRLVMVADHSFRAERLIPPILQMHRVHDAGPY